MRNEHDPIEQVRASSAGEEVGKRKTSSKKIDAQVRAIVNRGG